MLVKDRTYADVFFGDVIVDVVDAKLGPSTMSISLATYCHRVRSVTYGSTALPAVS